MFILCRLWKSSNKPVISIERGSWWKNPNFRFYTNNQDNRSDQKYGYAGRILLPALVGFSFFGKPDDRQEEKKPLLPENAKILIKLPDVEDEVITVLKHAKLKEIKQELAEAEQFYHRALGLLNVYQQNNTWDKKRLLQARVYIYDGLANLALLRGELDKAERLFKETLKGSLQQGMSTNHNAVIEISLKLAMIYASQKKNTEAAEGYKFCITTQEEKIKKMKEVDSNSAALLGMAIDAYARFLMVQNRNEEALTNLEKSLDIAKKVYGQSHAQVAVLLNDIATVGSVMKNYGLAKKNLEEAVQIGETVESPDLPTFYFNLGAIHEHLGEPSKASQVYNKAIVLAKKIDDKTVIKKARDALNSLKKAKKSQP